MQLGSLAWASAIAFLALARSLPSSSFFRAFMTAWSCAVARAIFSFSLLKMQSSSFGIVLWSKPMSRRTSSTFWLPVQPFAGVVKWLGNEAASVSDRALKVPSSTSSRCRKFFAALVAANAQGGGMGATAWTGASANKTSQKALIVGDRASSSDTSPPFSYASTKLLARCMQKGGWSLVASWSILETSTCANGRVTSSSSKPSLIGCFVNSIATGLPHDSNSALTFQDGNRGSRAPLTQTKRSPTSTPSVETSETTGTPFTSMTEKPSASPSKVTTVPPHWGLIFSEGGPRAGGGAFLRRRTAAIALASTL
mmetsp:Transcript_8324/g.22414  ORF Transcript_8324/g.22414 Transcript_8324/m.22414 type:complete len:311 (-) Transcript_8324:127-1059(-)